MLAARSRRRILPRFAALITALVASFSTNVARAQSVDQPHPSFGVWAGASFYAPGGNFLGGETDRDLFIAGVRAETMIHSGAHYALAATMDAIPLAIVTRNPYYTNRIIASARTRRGTHVDVLQQTGRGPVYGFGANPLGLELLGPRVHSVRPYVGAAGGFLWFTRNTPEPEARRLNATFEAGGGLRVARGDHRSLLIGWKFHHLSNAWTAPYNPGLDGNVFYVGFQKR